MKLTRFENLEAAIRSLGGSKVTAELVKAFNTGTKDVDPDDIIVGDFGIYWLSDEGVLTKVVVHIVDKSLSGSYVRSELVDLVNRAEFEDESLIPDLHKYHLVRCNTLERAENEGWRDKYKMSNRQDGRFFYRFVKDGQVKVTREDQRLFVCKNCLADVISTGFVAPGTTRDTFEPGKFLDTEEGGEFVGLDEQGEFAEHSLPNMYADDWRAIARTLKRKKKYRCEGADCPSRDLSSPKLRRYFHAHHKDMDKSNNRFSNLEALCIHCHAHQPGHEHMLSSKDYRDYLSIIEKPQVA